jgi:hypothetical protein
MSVLRRTPYSTWWYVPVRCTLHLVAIYCSLEVCVCVCVCVFRYTVLLLYRCEIAQ